MSDRDQVATSLDLTDLALYTSGRVDAAFDALRRESPVLWHPLTDGSGFWVISRYRDLVSVLRRPEVFSSEFGNILLLRGVRDPAAGLMAMVTDPPKHSRLRVLLASVLTARAMTPSRPMIRDIVAKLVEPLRRGATVDFPSAIAGELPIAAACALMGVPESDWPLMTELSHGSHSWEVSPEFWKGATINEEVNSANAELLGYFADLIAVRRRHPEEDLVSQLVHAEVDGQRFDDEEAVVNIYALMLAGYQVTQAAASGGMLALIENPDQFDLLVKDPSLLPSAVEEILRWASPTRHITRMTLADTEVAGVPIRRGDVVSVWPSSANRDEDVFEEPYRFSVARNPNRHVTLGTGRHFCVGAGVARLQLEVLFEALVEHGVPLELTGEAVRLPSYFARGYKHLPVRLAQ
jgi:cytochrome P450